MDLQTFYDKLQVLARKNPMLSLEDGSEISDPCHFNEEQIPPICLSPQDLEDPLAKEIVYTNGQGKRKLRPMQILEAYRQLVRLDNADGKLDGLLGKIPPGPNKPIQGSLIFSSSPISSIRFYGQHWPPPQRLQTFLKFYEGELSKLLPPPHPAFRLGRSFVEGRTAGLLEESYPLAEAERGFISETARGLYEKKFEQAGNLVSSILHKSRIVPLSQNTPSDLARTMLFRQYYSPRPGEKVEASVFFSAVFKPDGSRKYFFNPREQPLRGMTPRHLSLQLLQIFLSGRPLPPVQYAVHVPIVLRDTLVYRYLSYRTDRGELKISQPTYNRAMILHEALHAAALEKAPTIALNPQTDSFDWDQYAGWLLKPIPEPTATEPLVEYLANCLMIQRAALEVSKSYEQRLETDPALIQPADIEKQRLVSQLLTLADEATEYLIDDAAWQMTLTPLPLTERYLGSDKTRVLNPNEENIPVK